MPTDSTLRFTTVHKQLKATFVAYADFECILKYVRGHDGEEMNIETNITNTAPDVGPKAKIYQERVPRFAFKIVSIDSNYDPEIVIYKGEDAAEKFIEASKVFNQHIKHPKPMIPLTLAEERKFQQAETYHICDEQLDEDRVRDHCHILGHFRGAAHNQCNLIYRIKPNSWKLHVLFHNLRGYDGHLIVKTLEKKHGKTRVISNNLETYM